MGVHHFKSVQSYRKVANHLQYLKDNSDSIANAQQNPALLRQFTTNINSVIWSTTKLNVTAIKEFNKMIVEQFGVNYVQQAHHGIEVDPQLVSLILYKQIQQFETGAYLENVLQRNTQIPNQKVFMVREFVKQAK